MSRTRPLTQVNLLVLHPITEELMDLTWVRLITSSVDVKA